MDTSRHAKDLKIETLRGLALTLMVIGHVIGGSASVGMRVEDDSLLRYLYDSLIYVRMPLFTAISGYVYALRPLAADGSLNAFARGKAYRLGIPLVVVSTLFFLSQWLVPSTSESPRLEDFFFAFFHGYAHFWFLQAILVIFLLVALLERAGLITRYRPALLVLAGSVAVALGMPVPTSFFSLDRAVGLLPFFLLGLCVCRFADALGRRGRLLAIPCAALLLMAVHQAYLLGVLQMDERLLPILGMALGLCAIHSLIVYRVYWWPLSFLGYYAYEVYLFHVFGTAGTRIILNRLGVEHGAAIFVVGLAAGLLLPILLKRVVRHQPLLNMLLFGSKRPTEKRKLGEPALRETP